MRVFELAVASLIWQAATDDATLAAQREIIVTGERTPRTLSDTPSSVAVVTADMIEAAAAPDRIEQILAEIPNVQLGSGGQGPTIRGQDSTGVLQDLPAFLGGARPRVTLQVDGRAVGFNEFIFGIAPLWDVAQIEVFRSPQTTTQGRNSIGGAIFITTAEPSYEWRTAGRVIAGNYDTWQGSAMISGPIVEDQIALRIAADARNSRTSSDITSRAVGASADRDRYALGRLRLLAEPAALPGLRFETSYVHVEAQMPQSEGVRPPFQARRDPNAGYGIFSTNVDSLTATLGYTSGEHFSTRTTLSYGVAAIRRFAPPGLGEARTRTRDHSIETIMEWEPAGPLRLLGGVYYLRNRLDQFIDLSAVIGTGDFRDRQASLGLFGEARWRLLPALTLTAGLRYQSDRQDREGRLAGPAIATPIDFDRRFDAWLPKFTLAWQATDRIVAGLLIQRAFNPGGTTFSFDTFDQITFEAETLWSYEAFFRASLADGRLSLTGNLFYNDISDAQRPISRAFVVPGGATATWAEIRNVPAAESYGLEFGIDWRATRRLSLRGAIGLLKTRITETVSPTDLLLEREFQRAPDFSASAAIDWRPIDGLRLSAQMRHNSGYFSNDLNAPTLRIRGTTVFNARAAYTHGVLTLFGYARNLFDRFYMTFLSSPTFGTAGDPREIGIGVEARY